MPDNTETPPISAEVVRGPDGQPLRRWDRARKAEREAAREATREADATLQEAIAPAFPALEAAKALAIPEAAKAVPPWMLYLGGLTTAQSRRTAIDSMKRVAVALGGSAEDWREIPWTQLGPEGTTLIRAKLIEGYKPATVRLTLSIVRGVLKAAFRQGKIAGETVERCTMWPRLRAFSIRRGRALRPDEIARLREAAASSPMHLAMLAVMIGAGLRREEVATLSAEAFDGSRLRVIGKGRKERSVPLAKAFADDLRAWLAIRERMGVAAPTMFIGRHGKPFSAWAVWSTFASLLQKADITEPASPHDCRRTYGSALLSRTDIATVQAMMGHALPTTTAMYDRRGEKPKAVAAEALADELRVTPQDVTQEVVDTSKAIRIVRALRFKGYSAQQIMNALNHKGYTTIRGEPWTIAEVEAVS